MSEAISKAKRCELCPDDAETCYCYDDKPSVCLTESQLDEIVKEFVKPAEGENDRKLKMTVLSLVSDLRNCRAEYAEERAAHNAHVTELCELEQENRKQFDRIVELTNCIKQITGDLTPAEFVAELIANQTEFRRTMDELQSAHQEIERLRDVTKTLQSRLNESGVLYGIDCRSGRCEF